MCLGFWTFEDVIFWETLIFRMRKYFKHIFKKTKKKYPHLDQHLDLYLHQNCFLP